MRTTMWMAVAVLAATGCSDAKYLTGPEAFEWKPNAVPPSFFVKQKPEMKGEFSEYRGRLRVTVWHFPPGTELQLGNDKDVVDDGENHSASVSVDVTDHFARMPASALEEAGDLLGKQPTIQHGLSLVITPKGKPPVPLKLPDVELFDHAISGIFEHVPEDKGYVFKGEEKKAPARHKSVIAVSPFVKGVVGTAATLGDIDAVAVTKTVDEVKGKKACGGFADSSGRAMPAVTILLKESEVTIYDRRTGAELEKRRFPPNEECPTTVLLKRGSNTNDSYPAKEPILAWLKAWTEGVRPTTAEIAPAPIAPPAK